jgi:VIT1/CCC1 family predicted Fe2+/Mn2+ transporter
MKSPISIALTVVALIVGILKGWLTSLRLFQSVAEVVVVGEASASGSCLLGTLISQLLGIKT